MLDVINLAEELRHSIETGNQIHSCLALQWDETNMAALVRCSAWFGVPVHIPARNYFCQKPWSMPPWM
jgi:hypothetical protein